MPAATLPYPNLPNAPIEEAIISISVSKERYTSLEQVESVCSGLLEIYPQKKVIAPLSGGFGSVNSRSYCLTM